MQQFITHLLQISHGQWIYCNKVVHNKTSGLHCNNEKSWLQEHIDEELCQEVQHLWPEDWYLMMFELDNLDTTAGKWQEYWLLAVETTGLLGQMESFPPTGIW